MSSFNQWVRALQGSSREKKAVLIVGGALVVLGAAGYSLAASKRAQNRLKPTTAHVPVVPKKKNKAAVDREFLRQFAHFFPILVPGELYFSMLFYSILTNRIFRTKESSLAKPSL